MDLNQHCRARAFTLIELLLAIAIFSIVLVAMNMVFYAALRLRNKTAEAFDEAVPLQRAVSLIQHDLANLVPPGGILSGTLQSTPTYGMTSSSNNSAQANMGSATTMIPIMGAIQSSPFFFTSTGVINDSLPWADLQQVAYVLMQPTNQTIGKTLVRCVTRNLLPAAAPDQPEEERLLDGVQDIAFQYFDGLQWETTWDTTLTTNTLPLAIKVQIQMAVRPGQFLAQSPIELVVPLDVLGRTNQTSQATGTGQ
jgi:prepilin-type N-terminal cleavage/methylation domain-containing protein